MYFKKYIYKKSFKYLHDREVLHYCPDLLRWPCLSFCLTLTVPIHGDESKNISYSDLCFCNIYRIDGQLNLHKIKSCEGKIVPLVLKWVRPWLHIINSRIIINPFFQIRQVIPKLSTLFRMINIIYISRKIILNILRDILNKSSLLKIHTLKLNKQ